MHGKLDGFFYGICCAYAVYRSLLFPLDKLWVMGKQNQIILLNAKDSVHNDSDRAQFSIHCLVNGTGTAYGEDVWDYVEIGMKE